MDGGNLAITIIGLIIAAATAYFGYVAVRGQIRRRPADGGPQRESAEGGKRRYDDVFVSYADADADMAEQLAHRLRDASIQVFLVRWIEPGLVKYLETERALAGARVGVLLFSETTMGDLRIQDEYAALLQRAHRGGFRFIPARISPVTLPQFAAIRAPLDLSQWR